MSWKHCFGAKQQTRHITPSLSSRQVRQLALRNYRGLIRHRLGETASPASGRLRRPLASRRISPETDLVWWFWESMSGRDPGGCTNEQPGFCCYGGRVGGDLDGKRINTEQTWGERASA